MYGYIERFLRFSCRKSKDRYSDFACVRWFPLPEYPDGDPLWVHINLRGSEFKGPSFVFLDTIEPARIMYELEGDDMNMMRLDGVDKMPEQQLYYGSLFE